MGICTTSKPKQKRFLKQINVTRKEAGIKKIKFKKIKCLKCGKKFISEGIWNRQCDKCRKERGGIEEYSINHTYTSKLIT